MPTCSEISSMESIHSAIDNVMIMINNRQVKNHSMFLNFRLHPTCSCK